MTPIRKGTAAKLGLRRPQPSVAHQVAAFVRQHMPEHVLEPWQVYVLDELSRHHPRP